jgi:hypothetical protein
LSKNSTRSLGEIYTRGSTARQHFGEIWSTKMARLVLICDGDDLVAHQLSNINTIGRAPMNHIVIDNPAVSAQHAIIAKLADSYRLQDLHSTNGTRVNGIPITEVELKDGDKILFGSVIAVFTGDSRGA